MKGFFKKTTCFCMLIMAIVLLVTPLCALSDNGGSDPDAAAHEAQIKANAKKIYNQIIKDHGSAAGYVNWIAQQERYYRVTMNEAAYYNQAYNTSVSFCTTLAKVGVSVVSKSPSKALESVAKSYYNQFLKEVTKGLPKVSKAEFIYAQATGGIEEISTGHLWDIMDRVAENNGEFVSIEDAVDFIVGYQDNRAGFVSAELGRQYYYDQLNQSPFDTLGEIGVNVFISELSKKICPYPSYWEIEYLKGYAVTQMKNYVELLSEQLNNPHVTQWKNDLKEIADETERLLRYTPEAGSPYLPTLPTHTVTYNPNGGKIGVSRYIVYEGEAYGYMPTPYWFGYEFLGWFDKSEGGTEYSEDSIYALTSDQTLYAHWARSVLDSGSCGPNLNYVLYADGLLEITGCGEMTSAPWIDHGYNERIGKVAFSKVITKLCPFSFTGCNYLHEIDIPDKVEYIGKESFRNSGLIRLKLPSNLKYIGKEILRDTNVEEIVIPNSLTSCEYEDGRGYASYAGGAFSYSKLKSIIFESGITEIPPYVCYHAEHLESVQLPDSVRQINEKAFAGTKLTEFHIPEGVESLGCNLLEDNTMVNTIFIPKSVNGALYPFSGSAITSAILEEGISSVPATLFSGCRITEIHIPDSVTSIGTEAFAYSNLKTISLPTGLKSLGKKFLIGTDVAEINVPASVEWWEYDNGKGSSSYAGGAFTGSKLRNIVFESGRVEIPPYACYHAEQLESVQFPESLKWIKESAFEGTAISSIVIPKHIELMGERSFFISGLSMYGYRGTEAELYAARNGFCLNYLASEFDIPDCILPESIKSIEDESFSGCSFAYVRIPYGVEKIGNLAFENCSNLRIIEIPNSVTAISPNAFSGTINVRFYAKEGCAAAEYARSRGIALISQFNSP